ncbi:MAG: FAD-dependent oxidoreductase, partial [Clostridia bacterium]|nr:FAD-dependent oxidoreductase [Clostridia bacterium]
TLMRKNYHFYGSFEINMQNCKKAFESGKIDLIYSSPKKRYNINLYGHGQPDEIPLYDGTNAEDINRYVITNQRELLEGIKDDDRNKRDIALIPSMPQFRTTRCIDGNHIFRAEDAYKHFDDSISAICDFERKDFLYEVPYGALVKDGFDNLITAGRSAAAEGYGWDVLRVIPPAIVTGQAAGLAACQSIDANTPIYGIDVPTLQNKLESQNVMIHFDDSLIPKDLKNSGEKVDIGHF